MLPGWMPLRSFDIAAMIRDEHRAALDWLNDITSDDFKFFGLEVELWRIGDSDIDIRSSMS